MSLPKWIKFIWIINYFYIQSTGPFSMEYFTLMDFNDRVDIESPFAIYINVIYDTRNFNASWNRTHIVAIWKVITLNNANTFVWTEESIYPYHRNFLWEKCLPRPTMPVRSIKPVLQQQPSHLLASVNINKVRVGNDPRDKLRHSHDFPLQERNRIRHPLPHSRENLGRI